MLNALISRKVKGALLDENEVANLQKYLTQNKLRIAQKIESSKGIGFLLSGEMISLHSEVSNFIDENPRIVQMLIRNATDMVQV